MLHPAGTRCKRAEGRWDGGMQGMEEGGGYRTGKKPPQDAEKSKAFCGTGGVSVQKASERGDLKQHPGPWADGGGISASGPAHQSLCSTAGVGGGTADMAYVPQSSCLLSKLRAIMRATTNCNYFPVKTHPCQKFRSEPLECHPYFRSLPCGNARALPHSRAIPHIFMLYSSSR